MPPGAVRLRRPTARDERRSGGVCHDASPLAAAFAGRPPEECCFGCAPRADGLSLHAGRVGDRDVIACTVRIPSDLSIDGIVPLEIVWAILDCPSLWACFLLAEDGERDVLTTRGIVTGALAVHAARPVPVSDDLFVQAWRLGRDGRKVYGAAVLVDGSGEIVAPSRQTGIAL